MIVILPKGIKLYVSKFISTGYNTLDMFSELASDEICVQL